jgi:hypothetical protein
MALINTTTTGVLGTTVYGDGAGDLTVQQNGVTINKLTAAPAFSAYRATSAQSFTSATWSKVFYNAESYDTANCYDTTNYRFTPNVAGYYSVNVSVNYSMGTSTTIGLSIYKNGSAFRYGPVLQISSISSSTTINANYIVYLNGSTDYIEGYTYSNGTSPSVVATIEQSYFEACLIKAA